MAFICGPVFIVLITVATLIYGVFHQLGSWTSYFAWPILGSLFAGSALLADRLGKRFSLTPQEYAPAVALSCTLCPIIFYALLYKLMT